MDLLDGLNKEQKEAVCHEKGPLLVVAGAGTGKTTVLTRRIAYLIQKGINPNEILALTFTEKAAQEMEDRVEGLLDFGYYDFWISTFHSFCDRVLKSHGLEIGIPTNYKLLDETGAWILIKRNFDKFSFLKEYRPLGNPTKFIHALIHHFQNCKNEGIYPEDYLTYADSLKKDLVINDDLEYVQVNEVAEAYHTYQKLLLNNNSLDFGDLINYVLKLFEKHPKILEKFQKQFKYVLIDEFQDTNFVQYELVKKIAESHNNITVVGDDDQCLIENTLIEKVLEKGLKKIQIKNIKKGDKVLSGIGRGHIGIAKVLDISKNKKKVNLITIKTKKGNELTTTDNHKMFCLIPRTYSKGYHYVYLMHRKGLGWRIGKTDDLISRLRMERSADKIIALKVLKSDSEARYYETLYSLKYGIPTGCFKERGEIIIKNDLLEKLYNDLNVDQGVERLVKDLNLDLDYCHFCLDGVDRGSKLRVKINITMFSRGERKKNNGISEKYAINHTLNLETSNQEIIEKLEKREYNLSTSKKGKRIRIVRSDLRELIKIAKELQVITDGIIEVRFRAGLGYDLKDKKRQNNYAIMMPAKNLMIGHKIPIRRGNDIIYDEIIRIEKKKKETAVYDLEIEKAHNFLANNVLVHNSIFSFQGASFNNVLRFKNDYPDSKDIVLVENYRSPQNILDLAYNFIQLNNPNRLEYQLNEEKKLKEKAKEKGIAIEGFKAIDKKLKSNLNKNGLLELLSFETAEDEVTGIIDKIWELREMDRDAKFSDFCVLVRTNDTANQFVRGFERANVPCHFLASKGLYSHPIIVDIIAYFKVILDFYDSPNFYRILRSMPFDLSPEEVARIGWFANKKTIPLFEAIQKRELLDDLSEESRLKLNNLLKALKNHFKLSKEKNVSEIFVRMINDLHYAKHLKQATEENLKNWEIIYQFFQKTKNFENTNHDGKLIAFIDQIQMELDSGEEGSLDNQIESNSDSVKIMTVHSAKGLEFKYVFIVSLVHRKFPSDKKRAEIEIPKELVKEVTGTGDFHLEEERRLFYVALTRAKKGLFLTWASDYGGKQLKKPSRFLIESELIKEEDAKKQKLKKEAFSFQRAFNGFKKESNEILNIDYSNLMPAHFSFSQLAAFEKCPLQYKYAYILKIPTKGKPNFSFGKTIHNTLHRFVNLNAQIFQSEQKNLFEEVDNERKKVNLGLSDLFNIYKEEWIDAWFDDERHKEEYREKGKGILKNFYKDFVSRDFCVLFMQNEPALEKVFNINLNGNKFVGAIDRIDKIDDEIEIIDYKTGTAKKSLATDDKFQLEIYNLAANKIFDLRPKKLTYYYVEDGTYCSFEPKKTSLEKTEEKILNTIEKIKRSKFKPTAGWQCQYCDYKNICPHRKF